MTHAVDALDFVFNDEALTTKLQHSGTVLLCAVCNLRRWNPAAISGK